MSFEPEQLSMVAVQLAMGISLAACAGLRAFLPLLIVGAAGRLEWIPLAGSFDWLGSTPALVVFGVAVASELLADKFPVVDNVLDVVQVWVKPIAGAVLVASVLTDLSPLKVVVLSIVLGGSASSIVHLVKAKLRLLSTVASAGVANPVLSTAEDAGALIGSVTAILIPVAMLIVIVLLLVLLAWYAARRTRGHAARMA